MHPGFHNLGTLLFWTGMEKFNSTHFTYGMNDDLNYFLPSKYFNSTRIDFKPVVTHHVPLLNLQVCPEIIEMYRKGQHLRNVQAKDGSYHTFRHETKIMVHQCITHVKWQYEPLWVQNILHLSKWFAILVWYYCCFSRFTPNNHPNILGNSDLPHWPSCVYHLEDKRFWRRSWNATRNSGVYWHQCRLCRNHRHRRFNPGSW